MNSSSTMGFFHSQGEFQEAQEQIGQCFSCQFSCFNFKLILEGLRSYFLVTFCHRLIICLVDMRCIWLVLYWLDLFVTTECICSENIFMWLEPFQYLAHPPIRIVLDIRHLTVAPDNRFIRFYPFFIRHVGNLIKQDGGSRSTSIFL